MHYYDFARYYPPATLHPDQTTFLFFLLRRTATTTTTSPSRAGRYKRPPRHLDFGAGLF